MSLIIQNMVIVGPVEEFSKFIVFYLLSKKMKSIKEPRDGILQAGSVGLGFAIVENYFYGSTYGPLVLIIRSVLCIAGHITYASIWGFYTTMIRYESKTAYKAETLQDTIYIFLSIIPAAIIHGLYDLLLDIRQPGLAILINIMSLCFAIVLYRVMVKHSPFKRYPLSEYKKAIQSIRHALKVNPGSFLLNQRIALFYLYAEQHKLTLQHLNKCLKLEPGNYYCKAFKGIVLMLSNEEEQGKRLFKTAIKHLKPVKKKILLKNIMRLVKDKEIKRELRYHLI